MQSRRVSWAIHGRIASSLRQAVEMLVHAREDVLEHVLGVVWRQPERLHRDRVDIAREALHELVPGGLVAGAAARDELGVGGGGFHCRRIRPRSPLS